MFSIACAPTRRGYEKRTNSWIALCFNRTLGKPNKIDLLLDALDSPGSALACTKLIEADLNAVSHGNFQPQTCEFGVL
jgi:hypothetical protein